MFLGTSDILVGDSSGGSSVIIINIVIIIAIIIVTIIVIIIVTIGRKGGSTYTVKLVYWSENLRSFSKSLRFSEPSFPVFAFFPFLIG